jgi:hypothetical protein
MSRTCPEVFVADAVAVTDGFLWVGIIALFFLGASLWAQLLPAPKPVTDIDVINAGLRKPSESAPDA